MITVVDTTAPTFTFCPGDIAIVGNPNGCTATIQLPLATATDNCGGVTISYWIGDTEISTPHTFGPGVTTVTVKATDACGNVNDTDCRFEVDVSGPSSPADFDQDCDVDFDDFQTIAACLAGPDVLQPPPGCDPLDFAAADLDGDLDVDVDDFQLFQMMFTGP